MNYKWKKLFKAKGGHKYFRDEITGMIAVADDSGSTPDQTEDGVLWLDYKRCVCIATDKNGRTWITIPVLKESRYGGPVTQSCTPASAHEAVEVCARFNMRLVLDGDRFVLVREKVADQGGDDHGADQQDSVQA